MSETDQTMQAVMTVYRRELGELEAQAANLEGDNRYLQLRVEQLETDAGHLKERIDKLQGVIDTLKLELANEREAHTKAREAE